MIKNISLMDEEDPPALEPLSSESELSSEVSVSSSTNSSCGSWKEEDLRVLIYTTCYNVIDGCVFIFMLFLVQQVGAVIVLTRINCSLPDFRVICAAV